MATARKTTAKKAAAKTTRTRVRVTAPPVTTAPPPPAPQLKLELSKGEVMVNVQRPGGYKLTRDDRTVVEYPQGVQRMPEKDADHWWSINHGHVAKL